MAVVSSTANAAVKAARKLARRPSPGAFLVEGQAIAESLAHLRRLFVDRRGLARDPGLVDAARARGVEVVVTTEQVLDAIAGTVTPQGMIGVAALPVPPLAAAVPGARMVVVCWGIADPGNAGAVLRSADAAGADVVVFTAGSVDPRNPKAVRASAGSLFHLPVVDGVDGTAALTACRAAGLQLVAADPHGAVAHTSVDLVRPSALVLGSEAHGLPTAAADACDVTAAIPIAAPARPGYSGRAESLNLAATVAVLVFEAARQRAAQGADLDGARA